MEVFTLFPHCLKLLSLIHAFLTLLLLKFYLGARSASTRVEARVGGTHQNYVPVTDLIMHPRFIYLPILPVATGGPETGVDNTPAYSTLTSHL